MEFIVDDTEIDSAEVKRGTVEEALRRVQTDLSPLGSLVVALRCNGKDVPGGSMAEMLSKPVTDFERLEVFTTTKGALVTDAMEQALNSLNATNEECQRIAGLLVEGRTADGIQALGTCLGLWQQIHDAIGKSITMLELDVQTTRVGNCSLLEMIEKPKELLLEIKQALTAKDHVLLADIMQYEFGEVAGTWETIVETLRAHAVDVDT